MAIRIARAAPSQDLLPRPRRHPFRPGPQPQQHQLRHHKLSDQLHLEQNHAKTFWGLCARLYSKLTAHTLCVYLNHLLASPHALQIKGLAFAN